MKLITVSSLALAGLVLAAAPSRAGYVTPEAPILAGDTPATSQGWQALPVFTVGEAMGPYRPVGILDGIGALPVRDPKKPNDAKRPKSVRLLVNHELGWEAGYEYTLANGTRLTGARVSELIVDGNKLTISSSRLAFDVIYDRSGAVVTGAGQVNEFGDPLRGFSRFCSGRSVARGEHGFVDDVYFANEETGKGTPPAGHPHGGSVWALDVAHRTFWAAPQLGRGAWENVSPVAPPDARSVALILQDDTAPSPLYLYVGRKNALGNGSFLDRNGLAAGQLFVWVSDDGHVNATTFNTVGSVSNGHFVPLNVQDPGQAGNPGYDGAGYKDSTKLRAESVSLGAFQFTRPEDVHENPANPTQVVFVSTGRDTLFGGVDSWGTVYVAELDLSKVAAPEAEIEIVHHADDLADPDTGIRNPDNLTWSADGYVYIQEDRAIGAFGMSTGIEASMWQLDPVSGAFTRVGEIDRSAVPAGQTDPVPNDIGNWESSGVVDVSGLFKSKKGETLLIVDVQAHSLTDGPIATYRLVEGGQLLFFSNDTKRKDPRQP